MNGSGEVELPFKVLRFVAFICYRCALSSSAAPRAFLFNFSHLILQCDGGSRGENEAVERWREIPFVFPASLKAPELIAAGFSTVLIARLGRHISRPHCECQDSRVAEKNVCQLTSAKLWLFFLFHSKEKKIPENSYLLSYEEDKLALQ